MQIESTFRHFHLIKLKLLLWNISFKKVHSLLSTIDESTSRSSKNLIISTWLLWDVSFKKIHSLLSTIDESTSRSRRSRTISTWSLKNVKCNEVDSCIWVIDESSSLFNILLIIKMFSMYETKWIKKSKTSLYSWFVYWVLSLSKFEFAKLNWWKSWLFKFDFEQNEINFETFDTIANENDTMKVNNFLWRKIRKIFVFSTHKSL